LEPEARRPLARLKSLGQQSLHPLFLRGRRSFSIDLAVALVPIGRFVPTVGRLIVDLTAMRTKVTPKVLFIPHDLATPCYLADTFPGTGVPHWQLIPAAFISDDGFDGLVGL